jgi:hypothetical protein
LSIASEKEPIRMARKTLTTTPASTSPFEIRTPPKAKARA